MTTLYKIPANVKTFRRSGKYVMPWNAKELELAVKSYLRLGGFSILKDKQALKSFRANIHAYNPFRRNVSIDMVIYNIARCDKQLMNQNDGPNLYGGTASLLTKVLNQMDPGQVRFAPNSLRIRK